MLCIRALLESCPPSDEVDSPGWGREPSGSGQPYCWMLEGRTLFLNWLTAGRSLAGRCNVVHGLARVLGLLDAGREPNR